MRDTTILNRLSLVLADCICWTYISSPTPGYCQTCYKFAKVLFTNKQMSYLTLKNLFKLLKVLLIDAHTLSFHSSKRISKWNKVIQMLICWNADYEAQGNAEGSRFLSPLTIFRVRTIFWVLTMHQILYYAQALHIIISFNLQTILWRTKRKTWGSES